MPPRIVITDRELQRRSDCSFYNPTEIDLLEEPARQTIRWALRERHLGRICSAADLRERWTAEWKKGWGDERINSHYWKGVGKSATFARRVYEFLLKYEVRHPYEAYTLQFDLGEVKGENALVVWRKYRKGDIPMLVDPPSSTP